MSASTLAIMVLGQLGCSSTASNSVTFEHGGASAELAISDAVVRAVLEDALDSELECDGGLGSPLRSVFEALARTPRGHASVRDGDSTLYAKRRGGRLELRIDSRDGGRVKASMPWAVAECLLGRSTTLGDALGSGRVPISVEVTGSDGTRVVARLGG